jgi:hypothetical protein
VHVSPPVRSDMDTCPRVPSGVDLCPRDRSGVDPSSRLRPGVDPSSRLRPGVDSSPRVRPGVDSSPRVRSKVDTSRRPGAAPYGGVPRGGAVTARNGSSTEKAEARGPGDVAGFDGGSTAEAGNSGSASTVPNPASDRGLRVGEDGGCPSPPDCCPRSPSDTSALRPDRCPRPSRDGSAPSPDHRLRPSFDEPASPTGRWFRVPGERSASVPGTCWGREGCSGSQVLATARMTAGRRGAAVGCGVPASACLTCNPGCAFCACADPGGASVSGVGVRVEPLAPVASARRLAQAPACAPSSSRRIPPAT